MCKIGFVAFESSVSQDTRRKVLTKVLENSWNMGNRDAVGYVTWCADSEPFMLKALDLTSLKGPKVVGDFCLIHARIATCDKGIENAHPFELEGAYLVHNGIVKVDTPLEAKVLALCKTKCDSEQILASYILGGRSMQAGLGKISGSCNVMVYDHRRKVLSVFADSSAFEMWRQDGVFMIVQEARQTTDIIFGGLGWPYEQGELPQDKIYEFQLNGPQIHWETALATALKTAKTFKVPFYQAAALSTDRSWEGYHGAYAPFFGKAHTEDKKKRKLEIDRYYDAIMKEHGLSKEELDMLRYYS